MWHYWIKPALPSLSSMTSTFVAAKVPPGLGITYASSSAMATLNGWKWYGVDNCTLVRREIDKE
jgi:hypothetical protein